MAVEGADPAGSLWRWEQAAPLRWLLVDECTMGEPETAVAVCADIDGLFVDLPEVAGPVATLVGCRPEAPLRRALDALACGAGNPGGALWRRRISASILFVAEDGTATRVASSGLFGSVVGARASVLGEGLLDVTFDVPVRDPLPAGGRAVVEAWRGGRPTEPGSWAPYPRELREVWHGRALAHHPHGRPDRPAGATYHLDGRHVTDLNGFFCAIGEAVNGPGGYFGGCLYAVHDCAGGGWGARPPFRLVWHDSEVARRHLVAGYDRYELARAITFDELVEQLTADGVELELR